MIEIQEFVFNPFQENTYILYDETKECVIIDPGCLQEDEENTISRFIELNQLKPVELLYTHSHVDHVFGTNYISEEYQLKPRIHSAGLSFHQNVDEHAQVYGFSMDKLVEAEIKNKHITLLSNFENVTIFGFQNELIQVFLNIFNNVFCIHHMTWCRVTNPNYIFSTRFC